MFNLYESATLRNVTGPSIRPGGLDLTDRGVELAGLTEGQRVLDLGCGTGATAEHLRTQHGLHAVGIDPSSVLLAEARTRNPELPITRAAAEDLPFADEAFDGVISECVLSLTDDPALALAECYRVVQPGGVLIVSDVYSRNPSNSEEPATVPVRCCLQGARTKEGWETLIRDAGFSVHHWEDHSHEFKLLAARLVFAYGSLERFWTCEGQTADGAGMQRAAAASRPGYFLTIAHKESTHDG